MRPVLYLLPYKIQVITKVNNEITLIINTPILNATEEKAEITNESFKEPQYSEEKLADVLNSTMPQPCKTGSQVSPDYNLTIIPPPAYESHGKNVITQEPPAYPVFSRGWNNQEMVK